MGPDGFITALREQKLEHAFNPYVDLCPIHDRASAPKLRTRLLLDMLRVASHSEVDAIWIGRDLGYRGGRRTGLALTDDIHIAAHAKRWGVSPERATKGGEIAERTAAVVWSVLDRVDAPIFLWNVFPFHPHEPSNEFTNRSHSAREREVGLGLLEQLIALLRPKRLVAIGNDAANAALKVSGRTSAIVVRHPSYGGQTQFLAQMEVLYGKM